MVAEIEPPKSPEKRYSKYMPFKDVEDCTDGRIVFGIRPPVYVAEQLGVDVARLTALCNFANIRCLAVLPMPHEREQTSSAVTSLAPDGSATGVAVTRKSSPKYGFKIVRPEWVTPHNDFLVDAVLYIDTQEIADDISLQKESVRDAEVWQRRYDEGIRDCLRQAGNFHMLESIYPVGHDVKSHAVNLGPLLGLIAIGAKPEILQLCLFFYMIAISATNLQRLFNSKEVEDNLGIETRVHPSLFLGPQWDRAKIFGFRTKRKGLIGLIKQK
ncbi:hypothetical protein A2690_02495 [Candidatus Roizmanbacteria bacterium RIFCSPHIGHO2_01_FULL_39_12b]|uniref:Uncharacterized protein n=1 Tax=Candidatus Roizmanbacteria bacterium RIFCSPHIGHO2_01_FULL_39_12b TaxID=1802030 RepID=A0A1F7GDR3_9BACT|nr:MAG: hypothetical protein A2690_02495 [Candidatus Roizmanbacteria bacterium RIFCSPHIGHO2_01_FULL_39_12b]OGK46632.1 MAG: hypothetical protein A3B46_00305 [Candidatus Roizmanbacteria bacterium RIFCSPLOWO2_01_FULL_39_19]